jgi:hypothetical protein
VKVPTIMQASLAALVSVPKLPPETLAWLAAAETAGGEAANTPIPGLDETWNAIPFASVFADTWVALVLLNVVHEAGHRIVAGVLACYLHHRYLRFLAPRRTNIVHFRMQPVVGHELARILAKTR